MFKTAIAIIAAALIAVLAGAGSFAGLTKLNPSYDVEAVTGEVISVEPVGHRHSTGYVTKMRVGEQIVYREFRNAPTSDSLKLYKYVDTYDGDRLTFAGTDPNETNTMPTSLMAIIAGIIMIFVGVMAAGILVPRKLR